VGTTSFLLGAVDAETAQSPECQAIRSAEVVAALRCGRFNDEPVLWMDSRVRFPNEQR